MTVERPNTGEDMDRSRYLRVVREQIEEATAAKKCHSCGCLHSTVSALETSGAGDPALSEALAAAKHVLLPKKYDCLGCAVCFPANAANAFAEVFPEKAQGLDLCPVEAPDVRPGWPPLPGDFAVVRYGAPVAVCTLNASEMVVSFARRQPPSLSIVGTMCTENLGIERVIKNVLANPNIRFLVLCGQDTRQAIGHLPGQSMLALFQHGADAGGRIIGAKGKRPVLKNVTRDEIDTFIRQVEVVDLVGETDAERVMVVIDGLGSRSPGPFTEHHHAEPFPTSVAPEPTRLVPDPAGFFVIYPDESRSRLVVEHYTKDGVLGSVLVGQTPAALYTTIAERGLVTRLDHAAYLGRELARAERSLGSGEPYVQDRAAGVADEDTTSDQACGCSKSCGGSP